MSIQRTNNTNAVQYFICHNGEDVYHPVILHPDNTLETGQPYIEAYDTQELFNAALADLGIDIPT